MGKTDDTMAETDNPMNGTDNLMAETANPMIKTVNPTIKTVKRSRFYINYIVTFMLFTTIRESVSIILLLVNNHVTFPV